MNERALAEFQELIRAGAGVQDIHDTATAAGYAAPTAPVSEEFLRREIGRVDAHRRSLLPILEHFATPAETVLDIGCSTGGSTIAIALSPVLRPREVVGVDPNPRSIEAARIRARGHDLAPGAVRFEAIAAGEPLPFPDGGFDLVTCVSVLEFVSAPSARAALAGEIQRVTRPGGHIFLATPSPWRLREFHSRRWLGHVRRRDGYPWSSTPSAIRRMFAGCDGIPIASFVLRGLLERRRLPIPPLALAPLVSAAMPWQKHLFRKRA